jgi:hypothetical protein
VCDPSELDWPGAVLEFLARPKPLVARKSSRFDFQAKTKVLAAATLPSFSRAEKRANKLPKNANQGVCGKLFGNKFDFAGELRLAPAAMHQARWAQTSPPRFTRLQPD